ncbi:U11/U12 small nuclear ribonucleoprotein 25 kDa protein-like [Belonocnema kinseyi]|uniref:U11/U12 small nuclear ribonucleoprotein 25 kDa protein-like n=1 Tax=Belonocnema kinseyi TaxID=2817044 RepID=UPI00143D9E75|nr:U11/U12 small nuclear ribonucleoprotein 25 kDa protein-like [Belonocnema kinseyi]
MSNLQAETESGSKMVKMEESDRSNVIFSHEELVKLTKDAISKIIESDPLFGELPPDATLEEIKAQTAVVQGQAITLYLNREDLPMIAVVVQPHNTTVLDLKKAVKRHTNLSLRRENIKKKISWKHVWKRYCLSFNNTQLTNDNENIKAYGLHNKAEICFVKRRREKHKI